MTCRDTEPCAAAVHQKLLDALKHWDGSNLTSINGTCSLLDQSAADLLQLLDTAAAGMPLSAGNRDHLLGIRSSISRLFRMVDAASAFVAGMAWVTGDTGIFYNASGAQRPLPAQANEMEAICRA